METEQLIQPVAASLNIEPAQVRNTLKLLEEGNTVPFIARYRKEMTKGLDEEQILFIQQQVQYLSNLEKRKEDVLRIIETQGKLTEELRRQVLACTKLSQVDDIYRPYQQKRKTRDGCCGQRADAAGRLDCFLPAFGRSNSSGGKISE